MEFKPKSTKKKTGTEYKTLYMKKELADKIHFIARQHNTSFNNVVVSMIEDFFRKLEEK